MNRRLIGVFTFALLVAAGTSAVVYRLIVSHVQPQVTRTVTVAANRLVVAAHDLQVGALIADGDVTEASWAGDVPEQSFKTKADLVGRGVVANVYKGEPLTERRLAPKGAGAGLASTIPVGKRAVALRVNEVVGLAGFVLPGMRVDVLVAGAVPVEDGSGVRCRTVLQNIEVLSAGQKIERSLDGKPETAEVVNLLVTPDQAETLNLASTETKVQLVLRNPLDTQETPTTGTSMASLFGVKVRPQPVPIPAVFHPVAQLRPAEQLPTVEIFSGAKRSEQAVLTAQEKR